MTHLLTAARNLLRKTEPARERLPIEHPARELERRIAQCARLTRRLRRASSALEDALIATYKASSRHERTSI